MSLLRFLARSLFASAFVADGVRKVTSPAELAPEAEAFTARVTPFVQLRLFLARARPGRIVGAHLRRR